MELNILDKKDPEGAYKYSKNYQSSSGAVEDVYLDGIYDKSFEKLYTDAQA